MHTHTHTEARQSNKPYFVCEVQVVISGVWHSHSEHTDIRAKHTPPKNSEVQNVGV